MPLPEPVFQFSRLPSVGRTALVRAGIQKGDSDQPEPDTLARQVLVVLLGSRRFRPTGLLAPSRESAGVRRQTEDVRLLALHGFSSYFRRGNAAPGHCACTLVIDAAIRIRSALPSSISGASRDACCGRGNSVTIVPSRSKTRPALVCLSPDVGITTVCW